MCATGFGNDFFFGGRGGGGGICPRLVGNCPENIDFGWSMLHASVGEDPKVVNCVYPGG